LVLQPYTEFVFHPPRLWRIDFAWPHIKLAVEIESSVHRIKGRFAGDLDKYNQAVIDGWRLLRYTAKMVHSAEAIDTVKKVLGVT
jgi:very-short-patch-repair endonuclease